MGCWGGLIEVLLDAIGGGVVVKGGVWCEQPSIGSGLARFSLTFAIIGAWVRNPR